MPPEQENPKVPPEQESLNRQLEALGRYVADLQQQREGAKDAAAQPPPVPEPRRLSRRWLLLTSLLVVLALVSGVVVGAVAWSDDRPAGVEVGATGPSAATQSSETTSAVPVASVACKTAVDRANTMLATAVKLQRELAEYNTVMGDPSLRELSGREVVEKTAPMRGAGARESARFTQALVDYRQVVDQCQLQTR